MFVFVAISFTVVILSAWLFALRFVALRLNQACPPVPQFTEAVHPSGELIVLVTFWLTSVFKLTLSVAVIVVTGAFTVYVVVAFVSSYLLAIWKVAELPLFQVTT